MNKQLLSFIMGPYFIVKSDHKISRLDFMVFTLDGSYVCCIKRTRKGNWAAYYSGWYRCNNKDLWLEEEPKTYYNFCGPRLHWDSSYGIIQSLVRHLGLVLIEGVSCA